MSTPPREPLDALLARGLDRMHATLAKARREALVDYLLELARWNRAFNLTAVRDPVDMVPRHLLDSLAVLPWVRPGRLLDVGSGAGLPGLVLAIARPDLEVVLLDSNGKRVRFLRHVLLALEIANASAVQARVEDYPAQRSFDTVISRAFSTLDQMLELSAPLLAEDGVFLAMKGSRPERELAAVPDGWEAAGIHSVQVPGLGAQRHVVELKRQRVAGRAGRT
ncbi:MAG TPA: 16S rRNA (guanine(527)-N(7))-methyltransferase RsmG [Gammaproteobacteria bacterium]|nr:16S rRNA (guanine(527)-N(7))-methyltransferase RsmG [Gammaproteobacteria bacterium]